MDTPSTSAPSSPVPAGTDQWATTAAFGLLLVGGTLLVSSTHLLTVGALAGPVLVLPVVAAICLVAGLLARRGTRTGLVTALVVAVLALLGNLGHLVDTLGLPASPWDFVPNLAAAIGLLIAIPAAIAGLRHRPTPEPVQRRVRLGALGTVALGTLLSVGLSVTSSTSLPPDALAVEMLDNAYAPGVIEVTAGDVIGLRNLDAYGHTFTVVDLGIDVGLPGDSLGTVQVDSSTPPASYEVTCVLHPRIMVATLDVTAP